MRILYIVSELHWCGASISFLHLIQGMKLRGADVIVVAPNASPVSFDFVSKLFIIGVRYLQIPLPWDVENRGDKRALIKRRLRKMFCRILRRKTWYERQRETGKKVLRQIMQAFSPDIVHTNVGVIHLGFEICQELGIPHVWHLRDYHDLDFHWKPIPSWYTYKKQLQKSDAVITITDDIRRHYGLWDSPNATTIYNGCFDSGDVAMEFPKESYFFSASRLVASKGHVDVVKAFDKFWSIHRDYQLILAGIGDDRYITQLVKLINSLPCRDAIRLIGHQPDVRPWMRKALALVVASYSEGFGRMTAEAAFCGCLVIGRNTGGTKEILHQTGGFLFEDGDAIAQMAEKMEQVANLSERNYREMAEKAQERAVSLYSNECYVEKVYRVYQRLLNNRVK